MFQRGVGGMGTVAGVQQQKQQRICSELASTVLYKAGQRWKAGALRSRVGEVLRLLYTSVRDLEAFVMAKSLISTGPAREPEMHMKSDEKWSLHWAGEGFLRIELRQVHTIRPDTRLLEHLQDPVQRCTWRIGTARAILDQDDVFELFISERSETSCAPILWLNH
ncbi:hypothetical protein BDP67DRAFT_565080 [Colletotrichum lupini]|nr:hypothetical protein BDP67DRAFT_565080 [Colletotrichum lupini]